MSELVRIKRMRVLHCGPVIIRSESLLPTGFLNGNQGAVRVIVDVSSSD